MGDAYRIATKVPWEDDWRDWSPKFNTEEGVVVELRSRAEGHRGAEFREKVRGADFGKDRDLAGTIQAVEHDLNHEGFGAVVVVEANRDRVQWAIRKLRDADPVENRPEANQHIDFLYTWVFRDHRSDYPGVENWGSCVRRYIDGTRIWSEHSPWSGPDAGCNAIDYHASYQVMYGLSRDVTKNTAHVAKVLFYNHEWTPQTGWIPVNVGHYDHVHVEGPRDHGPLDWTCHY